ncbi:MAG: MFS transporter [Myxococcales bacterium]|nr:MFS transporter [Myxococcales bacterium]
MTTSSKLLLLGTLYLSQGLPFGFFTQALPVLLREQGLSLPAIGFTHLLALPWALKFLWAPVVDRHRFRMLGRRRSWILPLQALAIVTLALVAMTHPANTLPLLLLGIFAINLFAATQDIATDGLAVELLTSKERGIGNGVQVAGYRIGMIVGGGFLLIAFKHLGWANTMMAMATLLAVATIPVALHREEPATLPGPVPETGKGTIQAFLKQPGITSWLLILFLYKIGDAFATAMLRPFLVDAGMEMDAIGWLLGTAGFTAGLLGALAGGWGVNRLGRMRALIVYGVIQALAVTAYVLPAINIGGLPLLVAVTTVEHFAGGMATVALFTLMMDACRPNTEGSDYTVQASIVVIATGIAAALSGISAAAFGYAGHFVFAGVLCFSALALIVRVRIQRGEVSL